MKYLSLLITTIIFSALCYLVFSFAHWSFNITDWSAVTRLLWLFTLVVPAYNHSKKFIKL